MGHLKNVLFARTGSGVFEKSRLAWGKIRRGCLGLLGSGYVASRVKLRRGECLRCGQCCKLLYVCPHLEELPGAIGVEVLQGVDVAPRSRPDLLRLGRQDEQTLSGYTDVRLHDGQIVILPGAHRGLPTLCLPGGVDDQIVNINTVLILFDPDPAEEAEHRSRQNEYLEQQADLQKVRTLQTITRDGQEVQLLANIDLQTEVEQAVHWNAQGVGLYRSEFLYMQRSPNLPNEEEQVGVNIVRKALEEPIRQIAFNAGAESSIVVNKVTSEKDAFGFNAMTGIYEDLLKAGVMDPTKVTRTALENAASIAGLMLTTEAVICDKPEDSKSGPGMPDPGMGGMGGMGGGMGGMY